MMYEITVSKLNLNDRVRNTCSLVLFPCELFSCGVDTYEWLDWWSHKHCKGKKKMPIKYSVSSRLVIWPVERTRYLFTPRGKFLHVTACNNSNSLTNRSINLGGAWQMNATWSTRCTRAAEEVTMATVGAWQCSKLFVAVKCMNFQLVAHQTDTASYQLEFVVSADNICQLNSGVCEWERGEH